MMSGNASESTGTMSTRSLVNAGRTIDLANGPRLSDAAPAKQTAGNGCNPNVSGGQQALPLEPVPSSQAGQGSAACASGSSTSPDPPAPPVTTMATSVANSAGQGTSHVGPVTAGELDPANILKSAAAAGAKMLADKRRSEETLGGQSVLFGNCVPTSEEGQGPAAKRVAMGIEPKPKPKDGRRAPKEGAKCGQDDAAERSRLADLAKVRPLYPHERAILEPLGQNAVAATAAIEPSIGATVDVKAATEKPGRPLYLHERVALKQKAKSLMPSPKGKPFATGDKSTMPVTERCRWPHERAPAKPKDGASIELERAAQRPGRPFYLPERALFGPGRNAPTQQAKPKKAVVGALGKVESKVMPVPAQQLALNKHAAIKDTTEPNVPVTVTPMATPHLISALDILPVDIWLYLITYFHPLDRESFSFTCRNANHLVRVATDTWDATKNEFGGADKMMSSSSATGEPARLPRRRVITCIRHPKIGQCDYIGYQIYVLKKTIAALASVGSCLEHLEIHRSPLLTVPLLTVVLSDMPLLKFLGIYSCQLIDVSHTTQILAGLKSLHTGGARTCPVWLDFLPSAAAMFCFDSLPLVGVPALLFSILPDARARGAQLLHPDSAFLRYCQQFLPHQLLPYAELGATANEHVVHWMANTRNCTDNWRVHPRSNDARLWECTGRLHDGTMLPGCFFAKVQLSLRGRGDRAGDWLECWGCRLADELDINAMKDSGLGPANAVVSGWLQSVAANPASAAANPASASVNNINNNDDDNDDAGTVAAPEGAASADTAAGSGMTWREKVIASARAAAALAPPAPEHDQTWWDAAEAREEQKELQRLIAAGKLPPDATIIPPHLRRWVRISSQSRRW